jgi:hypothetical protein
MRLAFRSLRAGSLHAETRLRSRFCHTGRNNQNQRKEQDWQTHEPGQDSRWRDALSKAPAEYRQRIKSGAFFREWNFADVVLIDPDNRSLRLRR